MLAARLGARSPVKVKLLEKEHLRAKVAASNVGHQTCDVVSELIANDFNYLKNIYINTFLFTRNNLFTSFHKLVCPLLVKLNK